MSATTATPTVFISATSQDLGSFRKMISDVLVSKRVLPVDQDHSLPDDRGLWNRC